MVSELNSGGPLVFQMAFARVEMLGLWKALLWPYRSLCSHKQGNSPKCVRVSTCSSQRHSTSSAGLTWKALWRTTSRKSSSLHLHLGSDDPDPALQATESCQAYRSYALAYLCRTFGTSHFAQSPVSLPGMILLRPSRTGRGTLRWNSYLVCI